jgi:hypothetical protein
MLAGRRDDGFVRAPLLVPWGEADSERSRRIARLFATRLSRIASHHDARL